MGMKPGGLLPQVPGPYLISQRPQFARLVIGGLPQVPVP